jgi:uncharacterized protein VirK/YbjX
VLANFALNRDSLGLGYPLHFDSPYGLHRPPDNFLARSGIKSIKHRLKLFVRGITAPQLTLNWLDLWQTPKLLPLKKSHPRVLLKLHRPYLQRGLRAKDHWKILRQHYSFALENFSAATLKDISTCPGILLVEIPVAEAGHFGFRLLYDNLFEKEGELSLVFHEERKQMPVFALTFCISSNQPGRREIFAGGLQGCSLSKDRALVVAVTRGMFGIRPKSLLLFALQQLASVWNIQVIRAVSNENRVLPPRKISNMADYNQFWLESGGHLEADGNFTLPVTFSPRDSATIKPNKRAMYRHRYEMLASIGERIRQSAGRLAG